MSIGTIPERAQTLSGQIKQADADVVECGVQLSRARKQVELAESAETKAIANAARLREARDELKREACELIGQVGEPLVVAGEEVSVSADVGGSMEPPAPRADADEVAKNAIFGDGPAPERLPPIRRVSF